MSKKKKRGEKSISGKEEGKQKKESEQGVENEMGQGAAMDSTAENDQARTEKGEQKSASGGHEMKQDEDGGEKAEGTPLASVSISNLEEENSHLKDQLLRKQADFENFRKRIYRDKEEAVKYANQMLLLDLVGVIDDFERAIVSSEESKDFSAFHEGIILIEKQLTSMLAKKWGLSRQFYKVPSIFLAGPHYTFCRRNA